MQNKFRNVALCLSVLFVLFLTAVSLPAAETTIVGEVNDSLQIVTDDQIYEVQSNDVGDDLVFNHIGWKVKVTGTIRTEDDLKIIVVTAFEAVEE
jgi:hypothetical protein